MPHYGKLEEILVVSYDAHSKFEEYVFMCKWFKVNLAGANCTIVQDECGHTLPPVISHLIGKLQSHLLFPIM